MIVDKIDNKYLINISHNEALLLIKSLTNQLIHNNANVKRLESYTDDGEYFSIFVLSNNFKNTKEYKKWVENGMPTIENWNGIGDRNENIESI